VAVSLMNKILADMKRLTLRAIEPVRIFILNDLKKVLKNFIRHEGELTTCSLAFYMLISFIPTSLIIISVLSIFYDTESMARMFLAQLQLQLPSVNIEGIMSIINKIVYHKRYLAFIWIPFLFWWGSFIFDIIEMALEKAFRIGKNRKYWHAKIRHFVIIIGIAIMAFILTLFSHFIAFLKNSEISMIIERNSKYIPFISGILAILGGIPLYLSSLTTLFINSLLIFIIYRYVPPRKIDNWSLVKGALFASLSYEIVKVIFSYYITEVNDYTSIFGSLNTIVILMIWIWYTCFIFVIGAEIAWIFYEKKEIAIEFHFPD